MSVSAANTDPLFLHVKREAQDGKSVYESSFVRYEIRFTRNMGSGNFAASRMNNAVSKRK